MYKQRYTSTMYCNNHITIRQIGDNLPKLRIRLILMLDSENNSATGEITDNVTGEVISRFRKTCTE